VIFRFEKLALVSIMVSVIFITLGHTMFDATAEAEPTHEVAQGCNRKAFVVLLDVGHTPEAPGAISARGVTEFSFNLHLSTSILRRLKSRGFVNTHRLIMTGGKENLHQRSARAQELGAKLLLSLHHDSVQQEYLQQWQFAGEQHSFSDEFSGYSLFVSKKNPFFSLSLAFAEMLGGQLRGKGMHFSRHHAEQVDGERRTILDPLNGIYQFDDLIVLKSAEYPAVLFEAGIIANRREELELRRLRFRNKAADAVTRAVEAFCSWEEIG